MKVTLFHNPRCSKSRETLSLLQSAGIEPTVVEYLKTPLSVTAIKELLKLLDCSALEITRTNESVFRELGLANEPATEEALIEAIARHPVLMNRPIVCTDKGARLCRPPELVQELL